MGSLKATDLEAVPDEAVTTGAVIIGEFMVKTTEVEAEDVVEAVDKIEEVEIVLVVVVRGKVLAEEVLIWSGGAEG